jgi:hypothetical protein
MYQANIRIQEIFRHALELQQSGRLRNTIYCFKNRVYILNQNDTILLCFRLRPNEFPFENPVAFHANDCDSNMFYEEDGYIHFVLSNNDYHRDKKCKAPEHLPEYVHKLFRSKLTAAKKINEVEIYDTLLPYINKDLTHIEFRAKSGVLMIRQRDIYTGAITTIHPDKQDQPFLKQTKLKAFGPIGIRTKDFLALFSFTDAVSFYFSSEDFAWFENHDQRTPYRGFLSLCGYNELKG